jgi:serine/threonine protein kinase
LPLEPGNGSDLELERCDRPAQDGAEDCLFDSIRIGTLIGKGGYGSVYRCILDGEFVALKVLESAEKNEMSISIRDSKPASCSKVVGEKEIEVGRQLDHKNVIRTIDSATRTVEGREQTWIVLEFCESGSLQQLIQDMYFDSEQKVLRVTRDIATGMAYLHSRQILHGDLSSNNVIFDKDHVAKISDFGLSREFGGATIVTSALGTTSYMAPELLTSGKLNKASDVYSFGIILLEMLTGKRAFSGMRYVEVITNKLANESGLLVESIPSDAPQMLRRLILDCTMMDYKKRPTFDEIVLRFCDSCDIKTSVYSQHKQKTR